jgi:hypothetical protein
MPGLLVVAQTVMASANFLEPDVENAARAPS